MTSIFFGDHISGDYVQSTRAFRATVLTLAFLLGLGLTDIRGEVQSQPFKPSLQLESVTIFSDNLFLSPTQKLSDFSEVVRPSVGFIYGRPEKTNVRLNYTAELERFFRLDQYDADNHYVRFDGQLQLNQLTLDGLGLFHDVRGPNSEVAAWVHLQRDVIALGGEYVFNAKTSFGLTCRQESYHYLSNGWIDYQVFVLGGTFYRRVLPKTDLFGQFNHGWVDVESGADATYEEVNVGLRGKITSKITGTIKVGFQHRQYDTHLAARSEPVVELSLLGQLTGRTSTKLTLSRAINPSVIFADRTYAATSLDLELAQRVFRKVNVTTSGIFQDRQYGFGKISTSHLRQQWGARVAVNSDITKWLQVGVTYRFLSSNFTETAARVNQNFVSLHVRAHY